VKRHRGKETKKNWEEKEGRQNPKARWMQRRIKGKGHSY
jgi:hypothetical protein